jgi:hypothetical protein
MAALGGSRDRYEFTPSEVRTRTNAPAASCSQGRVCLRGLGFLMGKRGISIDPFVAESLVMPLEQKEVAGKPLLEGHFDFVLA